MNHVNSNNIGVVTIKMSPSMDICSYCHVLRCVTCTPLFFTLQETLKQHFIPILLPWNTFSQGEFNIFFA